MRILLLCTDAFGGHGGIALFNRELLHALALLPERGELVALPRIIPNVPEPLPPAITYNIRASRNTAAYAIETVRAASRTKFDLVICGHINLLPLARLISKRPLLIVHGIEAWRPRGRTSSMLLRDCRAIVAVSALTRDRLVNWSAYSGSTFVLPNAVRAEQYGVREKRDDLVERFSLRGKRVLLTVGRMDPSERYKGFDEVIEVLAALPQDFVYLIAGGGADMSRLKAKAIAHGVADRVRFSGMFAESEKADIYSLADVYVMPSRGEGFGFVFLEAMASGIPAIASKHDGGREALLGGQLGTLVDSTNPAEIRTAIESALSASNRRVPDALDYFSFENFTARVHDIIRQVV